jgi:uncharacterized membrane protein YdbT with pleckstrin-like domain
VGKGFSFEKKEKRKKGKKEKRKKEEERERETERERKRTREKRSVQRVVRGLTSFLHQVLAMPTLPVILRQLLQKHRQFCSLELGTSISNWILPHRHEPRAIDFVSVVVIFCGCAVSAESVAIRMQCLICSFERQTN